MDPEQYLDHILLQPGIKDMRRRDYIYASALGFLKPDGSVVGGCRRQEYYRLTGQPDDTVDKVDAIRKMLYGEYVGMAEVELAKRIRIYVGDEVAVLDAKHGISGKIDLVILDPAARIKPYIGIEHKSTWGYGGKGTISPGWNGKYAPKPEHVAQTAFYAYKYRDAIPRWWVRYLDRGTGETRKHEIAILPNGDISANSSLTGHKIGEILDWADSVHEHVEKKRLPEPDFSLVYTKEELEKMADAGDLSKTDTDKVRRGNKVVKGYWRCRFCRYVHACQGVRELPYDLTVDEAIRRLSR